MTKAILTTLAATFLLVGCFGQNDAPEQVQENNPKPRTVVVNEGMSEEEEEKLNERLADLEEEANDQPTEQTTQQVDGAEDDVLAAAQDYYAAAAGGNYSYTYDNLSAVSQGQFTEDEWVTKNTTLGSDAGTYNINSVEMSNDSTAEVQLTIAASDGSSSERTTLFVLENGSWMHQLTQEEYDLFAGATASSASASDSASASSSASADSNANTKHVEVVITSNKPADVSINDDRFKWVLNEEIVGTETYERDLPENAGLSVSAITAAFNAKTTIEVYEDGTLVAQDSDSNGNAIVTY